ncbi:MAG: UDP-N-acetylglucosamine 2-epimerase (non-hydrolyzing) [Actinomycetia bacterium]|nr:UDP-N-acetylglucosamine 2-epimerase (non-hydrolyzing) [Actinomycetes bacterium]
MKVISVVGARPQFVKLAPVAEALSAAGIDHQIVHTGQHYDERMSDAFFADLVIPTPDYNLAVGSGRHGAQTGEMMSKLEPVLSEEQPDWVLTYGDTNSTLAAAITAVKLHLPLAHLEAGLRSFNRLMPEEHNRVLTDHASDLLLAPTELAMDNLRREGLADRTQFVGDVMADVCLRVTESATPPQLPAGVSQTQGYLLATIHRAENTDDPARLGAILAALRSQPIPVVLTAHPRLVAKANDAGLSLAGGALHTVEPYRYPDMIAVMAGARAVVTDSGGLQKEAYLVNVPCITVRTETEWVETVTAGWNTLDPDLDQANNWANASKPADPAPGLYGSGKAATHVAEALLQS